MFRFSIRDLLWLTVVVAMGLGWWLSVRMGDDRDFARVVFFGASACAVLSFVCILLARYLHNHK